MAQEFWSLGLLLVLLLLVLAPPAILLFRPKRMPGTLLETAKRLVQDYWVHFALFGVIQTLKTYVDSLNDPIRGLLGNFTFLIHTLEGDLVIWIQQTFQHPVLTELLNFNYLFGFMLLSFLSVMIAAYADDREVANQMILVLLVLYILTLPIYVFFNVQVTSDYLPGMKSLLYHSRESYFTFFATADPLDNAWPSLHIGIPYAYVLVLWWTLRDRGIRPLASGYAPFLYFAMAQLAVYSFSVLYLGVHWVLDIPGGLLMGYLGAMITKEIHRDAFSVIDRFARRINQALSSAWHRVQGG